MSVVFFCVCFVGKVVVVIGVVQGILCGVVLGIVVEGGQVLMVDCVGFIYEVVMEVFDGWVIGFVVDFEIYDGVWVVMVCVIELYGCIDLLVNGVGGVICMCFFVEFEVDQIDVEICCLFMFMFYGCYVVLLYMLCVGWGIIVNVFFNVMCGICWVLYLVVKGGVNVMIMVLVMEYGEQGICVVVIVFGGMQVLLCCVLCNVQGDSVQEQVWMQEVVQQVIGFIFFKCYVMLEEQIVLIFFMVFDEVSYIIGVVLLVVGGDNG